MPADGRSRIGPFGSREGPFGICPGGARGARVGRVRETCGDEVRSGEGPSLRGPRPGAVRKTGPAKWTRLTGGAGTGTGAGRLGGLSGKRGGPGRSAPAPGTREAR